MHPNRIHRRQLVKAFAGAAVFTPAVAQDVARRTNGLPALTMKDVKVITSSAGGRYRWVFLKQSQASLASCMTCFLEWPRFTKAISTTAASPASASK